MNVPLCGSRHRERLLKNLQRRDETETALTSFLPGEYLGYDSTPTAEAAMNLTPTGAGMAPKYPKVTVKLVGKDANASFIVGKVAAAMDEAGVSRGEVDLFMHAAMAHDTDHMLRTVMSWAVVR
jgi:hypothetical protein